MRLFGVDDLPAKVETFGDKRVDFSQLLKRLRSGYDVEILDLQGGPSVATQFLQQQLIDEQRTTRSPVLIGAQNSEGESRPGMYEGAGFGLDNPVLVEPMDMARFGNHLFLRERLNYGLQDKI